MTPGIRRHLFWAAAPPMQNTNQIRSTKAAEADNVGLRKTKIKPLQKRIPAYRRNSKPSRAKFTSTGTIIHLLQKRGLSAELLQKFCLQKQKRDLSAEDPRSSSVIRSPTPPNWPLKREFEGTFLPHLLSKGHQQKPQTTQCLHEPEKCLKKSFRSSALTARLCFYPSKT